MNWIRALPVFSLCFAAFYAIGVFVNTTWFYYYPKINRWHIGHLPRSADTGTPSAWYSWTATALIGALLVIAVYLMIPERAAPRVASAISWLTPLAAFCIVVYAIAKLFWIS